MIYSYYFPRQNLVYSILGEGSSTILCLHGLTRNSSDFFYLAKSLSIDHKVISIDMPGRGQSDYLQDPHKYNYNTYYRCVIDFLNSLHVRNVKIVGTSMGGIIAMYVAAYSPDIVSAIVLNDIGPYIALDPLRKLSTYVSRYPAFANKKAAEDYLRMFLSPLALKKEEHWSHMIDNSIKLANDGNYYLNYDPKIGKIFEQSINSMDEGMNLWHVWQKIKQPILVLRGQKSTILTEDTVNRMKEGRDNVDSIEYQGVGHVPSLMENEQIDHVKEWLNTRS